MGVSARSVTRLAMPHPLLHIQQGGAQKSQAQRDPYALPDPRINLTIGREIGPRDPLQPGSTAIVHNLRQNDEEDFSVSPGPDSAPRC
jgi:hypothetical protein